MLELTMTAQDVMLLAVVWMLTLTLALLDDDPPDGV